MQEDAICGEALITAASHGRWCKDLGNTPEMLAANLQYLRTEGNFAACLDSCSDLIAEIQRCFQVSHRLCCEHSCVFTQPVYLHSLYVHERGLIRQMRDVICMCKVLLLTPFVSLRRRLTHKAQVCCCCTAAQRFTVWAYQ